MTINKILRLKEEEEEERKSNSLCVAAVFYKNNFTKMQKTSQQFNPQGK